MKYQPKRNKNDVQKNQNFDFLKLSQNHQVLWTAMQVVLFYPVEFFVLSKLFVKFSGI